MLTVLARSLLALLWDNGTAPQRCRRGRRDVDGEEAAESEDATQRRDTREAAMTEMQRRVKHEEAQAQLDQAKKWNDEMTKLTDSKDYDKFLTRGTLARAPVVKDWITAELDQLNDALPKAAYSNGTVFADAAAKVESLNTAIKLMLLDLLGGKLAVTNQIACKANAKTSAISCDGIKEATVQQGQATSTLYTIINAINTFFGEIDFDNFKVPDAGVLDKLTKDADVELDFEFSYADADFRASPYHRSMGGFLGNSQCDAIESSLSYEIAMETFDQFRHSHYRTQDKFMEYIKDMVELASIYTIDELAFCDYTNRACTIRRPFVADTNERRARRAAADNDLDFFKYHGVHSDSPANFNMRVRLTVKGGMAMFAPEALASAMGIGMWGANAMYLQLAKVESVADALSSTTTTTVRVTSAPEEVVLKEADVFTAADVDPTLDTADKLGAVTAKLAGQLEIAHFNFETKATEATAAKAYKDTACADQPYPVGALPRWASQACDAAKKGVEAALNEYDQAIYDAAVVGTKYAVYAALADKAAEAAAEAFQIQELAEDEKHLAAALAAAGVPARGCSDCHTRFGANGGCAVIKRLQAAIAELPSDMVVDYGGVPDAIAQDVARAEYASWAVQS